MTPERDEIERLQRGGAELGRILDRTLRDALDASGRHDVIGEDGDGDWALVWETLAELRPRAEAAEARLAAVEALHVRTSTEHGPDFCKGCSDAAQEWVKWPCPTAAVLARSQAPQAPAEQEGWCVIHGSRWPLAEWRCEAGDPWDDGKECRAGQRVAKVLAPRARAEQEGDDLPDDACGSDGGFGIGAGHRCRCNRKAGHALDSDRPHGCSCGAMWSCADCASADMAGCAQCGAMPELPAPSVRPDTADDEPRAEFGEEFCALSERVDGKRHTWRFDGDDPYIVCHWCDEVRDARTGRVVREANDSQDVLGDNTADDEGVRRG